MPILPHAAGILPLEAPPQLIESSGVGEVGVTAVKFAAQTLNARHTIEADAESSADGKRKRLIPRELETVRAISNSRAQATREAEAVHSLWNTFMEPPAPNAVKVVLDREIRDQARGLTG